MSIIAKSVAIVLMAILSADVQSAIHVLMTTLSAEEVMNILIEHGKTVKKEDLTTLLDECGYQYPNPLFTVSTQQPGEEQFRYHFKISMEEQDYIDELYTIYEKFFG